MIRNKVGLVSVLTAEQAARGLMDCVRYSRIMGCKDKMEITLHPAMALIYCREVTL